MMLTSEMIRAARALLRWEQTDLAEAAGLSLATVKRLEKESGPIPGTRATAAALEATFSKARIEFSYDRGEGVTRLKAPVK
ncbi:helix-turn-helix domain-containing protein [Tardiphaga sp. 862_B3_N4_1]|uniref:helix-turn-helix domain-containing protein n=1 Tax=Tardiphaga sp. 862_B3_N4_1 TaxID=3240764 RepID=UPI003F208990